jgi:hypothetical protein
LSGFDRPGSTTGDASLSSAFVERDVETLAAALILAAVLDHPRFDSTTASSSRRSWSAPASARWR